MRDNMAIIVSQKEWKNGISDSHYEGIVNLRNINIDDVGVLRIGNKPSLIHELKGTLLDLRKNYYDYSFDWYGILKDRQNGRGTIYQSKNGQYYDGYHSDIAFSGGVTFKNYLIPFPNEVNEDAGYFLDSDQDGIFEARGAFETLLSEGTTQTYLERISANIGKSQKIVVLSNTHYAQKEGNAISIYLMNGTLERTLATGNMDDFCRCTATTLAVMNASEDNGYIKIYDWTNGTLITQVASYNPAGGNDWKNARITTRSDGYLVIAVQVIYEDDGDYLHRLELDLFFFNGTTITSNGGYNVSETEEPTDDFEFDHYIAGVGSNDDGRIVVLFRDIYSVRNVYIIRRYGINNWEVLYSTSLAEIQYGAIAQFDTDRVFIAGQKRSLFSLNESTDTFQVFNDNLITPPGNIVEVSGYDGMIGLDYSRATSSAVYSLIEGSVDYTPSIVGSDDFIYYANGSNVGSLQEVAGTVFDPTNDETYSINFSALDLPAGTVITAFGEVEKYLIVGTKSGKLYFWDRGSDSFEFPVNIGEPIASIGTKNNLLYVVSQDSGNIYLANMTSFQKIKNVASLTFERFGVYTNGIEFFDDGAYMGAKVTQDMTYTGIWVYRNNAWTLIGTDDAVEDIIKSSPEELIFATLDKIYSYNIAGSPSAVWVEDDAFIISRMEQIGTVANKGKGTQFSIYFDNPLLAGEGFKLFYRTRTNGDWLPLLDISAEQLGEVNGLFAYTTQLAVPQVEQIQYKLSINTVAGMVRFEIV